MQTYDDGAFERFCADLVNQGFSPLTGTGQRRWSGPLRPSLQPLTTTTRMQIWFYDGWPLRYAHVVVQGLQAEHAAGGIVCLWAEDDPAQIAGRDLDVLWKRLDEWAVLAETDSFPSEDRALDTYLTFDGVSADHRVELPVADLVKHASKGHHVRLTATKRSNTLLVDQGNNKKTNQVDDPQLEGALYLHGGLESPPRSLDEFRNSLTRKQQRDFDRGLARRTPAGPAAPSGGHDFVVLVWPRQDGAHDAIALVFDDQDGVLRPSAVVATSNDIGARRRRAGPDADLLEDKKVLVAGAGSVGGHVAVALASAGVGKIILHDRDRLNSGNIVRHVCLDYAVGYPKVTAVSFVIRNHAPWTVTETHDDLSLVPSELTEQISGADLVVDCTGVFSVTAALSEICRQSAIPLVTGALFHGGRLARVQRQATDDTPIGARQADPAYFALPPEDPVAPQTGFVELGCAARVHNASPIAVLHTAAEISQAAVDLLTGRRQLADERIVVHQALGPPFDRPGTYDGPRPDTDDKT